MSALQIALVQVGVGQSSNVHWMRQPNSARKKTEVGFPLVLSWAGRLDVGKQRERLAQLGSEGVIGNREACSLAVEAKPT